MKTQQQVLRYISLCSFSDNDWQLVLDFCKANFNKRTITRPSSNNPLSTFKEFKNWFKNGYGTGDIVRYGHTLGIVGAHTPQECYLSTYLSFDERLIQEKLDVFGNKLMESNKEEIQKFNHIMLVNNVVFDMPTSQCVSAYVPKSGNIVNIEIDGKKTWGIYRSNDDTNMYFYCYAKDKEIIKDAQFPFGSIIVSESFGPDARKFLRILSKNKMEWSASKKELKQVPTGRVGHRKRYWYISERFAVCSDLDMHTKVHDCRYKAGNYFISFSTALLFCLKIQKALKEFAEEAR